MLYGLCNSTVFCIVVLFLLQRIFGRCIVVSFQFYIWMVNEAILFSLK